MERKSRRISRQALNRRIRTALAAALLLAACSRSPLGEIQQTLDAREKAINTRNLDAYAELISPAYRQGKDGKKDVVKRMQRLFAAFDSLHMESFGRDVFVADDNNHARAAQSYRLTAVRGGDKREILQREELSLVREDGGWRISAGL